MSEEKQTILIVDDERLNLKLLKAHLSVQGYTVLEAAGGAEALEKAKEKPDLILLDVMMPNMDRASKNGPYRQKFIPGFWPYMKMAEI